MLLPSFIPHDDLENLFSLLQSLQKYQKLAEKHGIKDIFQDNGGKLLQLIIILGLKVLPGRMGNDAIDILGNEFEIKTLNIKLTKSFSTNHHINNNIIQKYKKANWLFAVYEDIELQSVYYMMPENLQIYFETWESKLKLVDSHINNPKISLKHVQNHGFCIWKKSQSI